MVSYRVSFFKELLSSDGHSFKVLQKEFDVRSNDPAGAIKEAQHQFAHSCGMPDWKLRADCFQLTTED